MVILLALLGFVILGQVPARTEESGPALAVPSAGLVEKPEETIRLGSFNIRSFSRKSRSDHELAQIADRIAPFDLCAIQELRNEEALLALVDELNLRGSGSWSYLVSTPVGRGSTELYGFVYRSEKIRPMGPLMLFPDTNDLFIREPAWARFSSPSQDFVLATVHLLFGDSMGERRAEAQELGAVMEYLENVYVSQGEADFILAGDFNLAPSDRAFDGLRAMNYLSVNPDLGTTIRGSPFDTFWYSPGLKEYQGLWGMEAFDDTVFSSDDEAASLAVSDHRPIWMDLVSRSDDD